MATEHDHIHRQLWRGAEEIRHLEKKNINKLFNPQSHLGQINIAMTYVLTPSLFQTY